MSTMHLTPVEAQILAVVRDAKTPPRGTEIWHATSLRRGTVYTTLNRLADKGCVAFTAGVTPTYSSTQLGLTLLDARERLERILG